MTLLKMSYEHMSRFYFTYELVRESFKLKKKRSREDPKNIYMHLGILK